MHQIAKLALKGALLHLGVKAVLLNSRQYNHNYHALAQKLIQLRSHRSDEMLIRILKKLPDPMKVCYYIAGMSRMQLIELALEIQFVAASASASAIR